MSTNLITTQHNNGEGSHVEKGSNKNYWSNTTKLNPLILYSNLSFLLETCIDNACGTLNITICDVSKSIYRHLDINHEEWPMSQCLCTSLYRSSSNPFHQGGNGGTTHNKHNQSQSSDKPLTIHTGNLQDKYFHLWRKPIRRILGATEKI